METAIFFIDLGSGIILIPSILLAIPRLISPTYSLETSIQSHAPKVASPFAWLTATHVSIGRATFSNAARTDRSTIAHAMPDAQCMQTNMPQGGAAIADRRDCALFRSCLQRRKSGAAKVNYGKSCQDGLALGTFSPGTLNLHSLLCHDFL
jgi:hypothetical protein